VSIARVVGGTEEEASAEAASDRR